MEVILCFSILVANLDGFQVPFGALLFGLSGGFVESVIVSDGYSFDPTKKVKRVHIRIPEDSLIAIVDRLISLKNILLDLKNNGVESIRLECNHSDYEKIGTLYLFGEVCDEDIQKMHRDAYGSLLLPDLHSSCPHCRTKASQFVFGHCKESEALIQASKNFVKARKELMMNVINGLPAIRDHIVSLPELKSRFNEAQQTYEEEEIEVRLISDEIPVHRNILTEILAPIDTSEWCDECAHRYPEII
jgi:hypothetical protein